VTPMYINNGRPHPPTSEACQTCGDNRESILKILFLGKPLCLDWRPCARRHRKRHAPRKTWRNALGQFASPLDASAVLR